MTADNDKQKRKQESAAALSVPPLRRGTQFLVVVVVFVLGVAMAVFVLRNPLGISFLSSGDEPMGPSSAGSAPADASAEPAMEGEREVRYWYAPMDATFIRDEPGLSPMGMKLVPKYADEVVEVDSSVLRIDPVQVQNTGVVSVLVRRGDISRTIRTVGILDFDADRLTWVNVKFAGWIEKVHINYVGQEVNAGDPLFEIYSPDLVTTQDEYLHALEYRDSFAGTNRPEARKQAESLLQSTRDRLAYWDITSRQIEELEKRREVRRLLTVVAPETGVVVEMAEQTLEGMFVQPGENLYRIADLSTVWAHMDIYERDMPWVYPGQPARVSLAYDLDREYQSKVLFLYPEVSQETRTVKICVSIPNPDGRLRPGMYANVVLQGQTVPDAVIIPRSAILHSGERNLVFVDLGEGRFDPREVKLGVTGEGDIVQVVDGVSPGESVVTQAQFMLDSESRIQEAIGKFLKRGAVEESP